MSHYQTGQVVNVTVERVLPFGVFVRLGDGRRAYIRRRELDLDADVEPSQVVREGDVIAAAVISPSESTKHIELSRRATLSDPWEEFVQRFREGAVVRGTVQALHPRGVFVRIMAGVNGFVPLAELAIWQVTKPEELLWIGDEVEAVITRIALSRKKVGLSIKARLEQRAEAVGILERVGSRSSFETSHATADALQAEEHDDQIDPATRERVGRILVVDDHAEVRTSLAHWLSQRGFKVAAAASLTEAIDQVQQKDCRVVLVDLNLSDSDGLELIGHIRKNGSRAHICVMSSPDSLAERTAEIEAARVAQVFSKPLDVDEIERFLLCLARGESVPIWRAAPQHEPSGTRVFRELAAFGRVEGSALRRLQTALASVTQTLHAQMGLIFTMDPMSRAISILDQVGDVALNKEALYGLDDSPVKDVIHEATPIFENRVGEKARARFSKLLDLLPFESCIGVPVQVQDEIHHAAFFFHREPDAFSSFRLRDAQAGVLLFAALLEADAIHQNIQLLNPILLSGQLAAAFGHEVSTKISGLEIQLRNLLDAQRKQPDRPPDMSTVLISALDLKSTVEAFQQLLSTKEGPTEFDVNVLVQHTEMLVRPLAHKHGTKIITKLAPNLPSVVGNSLAVQQVFLNLMLNAVQQMALKAETFRWKGRRILEVSTSLDDKGNLIQVRFADTGPGIHRRLWDKIFTPGFSTRGGSGLGLFIARSFTQSLGSAIRVEESFVPLGTTFLIELPVITQDG